MTTADSGARVHARLGKGTGEYDVYGLSRESIEHEDYDEEKKPLRTVRVLLPTIQTHPDR
jgi:hypothetical protein